MRHPLTASLEWKSLLHFVGWRLVLNPFKVQLVSAFSFQLLLRLKKNCGKKNRNISLAISFGGQLCDISDTKKWGDCALLPEAPHAVFELKQTPLFLYDRGMAWRHTRVSVCSSQIVVSVWNRLIVSQALNNNTSKYSIVVARSRPSLIILLRSEKAGEARLSEGPSIYYLIFF